MSASNLEYQLTVIQRLYGYSFGRTADESKTLTAGIASWLSLQGVEDIRDLTVADINVNIPHGSYVKKGYPVAEVSFFDWIYDAGSGGDQGPIAPASVIAATLFETVLFDDRRSVRIAPLYGAVTGYATNPSDERDFLRGSGYRVIKLEDVLSMPVWGAENLAGGYSVSFGVRRLNDGSILFIPAFEKQQSTSEFLREFLTLAFALASFVVPGVGAAITNSIFGAANVAAYPALTSIASSAIVNTALSGGDIEAAVTGALSGFLGGSAGSFVSGLSDSQVLGKFAAAATGAALSGGDVQAALTRAAIGLAPGAAGDAAEYLFDASDSGYIQPTAIDTSPVSQSTPTGANMLNFDYDYMFNADGVDLTSGLSPTSGYGFDVSSIADFLDASAQPATDLPLHFSDNASLPYEPLPIETINYSDNAALPYEPLPIEAVNYADADMPYGDSAYSGGGMDWGNSPLNPPAPQQTGGFGETVKDITALALAALQINSVYQQVSRGAPIPSGARSTVGATVTGRPDGTIVSRNPTTGQTAVARPPVGQAYVTPEGGAIVNNGNGTYTYAGPDGSSTTRSYTPSQSGGMGHVDTKTLAMLGLGVGVAILMLKK